MALPQWISGPLSGTYNVFIVDPNVFYPKILKELGVETPDRYWLEVAFGIMKLDFDVAVRMSGVAKPGRIERRVRADDGRKELWNLTMHKPGKIDWNKLSLNERSRHIRENYKRIRGFIPSG